MSSLFDDSFLADLQPSEEEHPPPPEESHAPEAVPDDLFGGRFDAPVDRDAHYRGGAPRPVIDAAALLDGLNEQQRAAVVHAGSPLLIVAGAGSGKTRVLTHRIAYLLATRGVHPGQILAITFTNKAAGEMKERVGSWSAPRRHAMWVMTFHSACVRILRARAQEARLHLGVLDLRRGRLPAADGPGLPRPGPRPQALPAAGVLRQDLQPEERADRRGDLRGQAADGYRADARRGLHRVPGGGCARPTRSTSTT